MAYINTSLFTVQHPTNPNRDSIKSVFGQNKNTMLPATACPHPHIYEHSNFYEWNANTLKKIHLLLMDMSILNKVVANNIHTEIPNFSIQ